MTEIKLRSDFDVELLDVMGTDHRIVQAAKISQLGKDTLESNESERLIQFLMSERHGSPFEHCVMQWMISAPIFVWREFHRHRIASYNEQSSRWTKLEPVFYVPSPERPTKQVGRTGDYRLEVDESYAPNFARDSMQRQFEVAYESYEEMLSDGVAREVARIVLPVSIYSSCFVTMNIRALMNFLSLRCAKTAQHEIRQVAHRMRNDFEKSFPQTHRAWAINGMVAP